MQWLKLPHGITGGPVLATCSLFALGVWVRLFDASDPEGWVARNDGDTNDELVTALCHRDPLALDGLRELTRKGIVTATDRGVFVPQRVGVGTDGTAPQGSGSRGGKSPADRAKAYRERRANGTVTAPVTGERHGSVTGSVTDANGSIRDGERATRDASQDTVTAHVVTERPVGTSDSGSVTGSVTAVTGSRVEEREENRGEESGKESVTDTAVTAPPTTLVLSSPPAVAKPKRSKPAPLPDPVPMAGSLARRVFDAIAADSALSVVVEGPGDFAHRITADGAYPGVDVLAEVRRAGLWLASNPGRWNSRAGLATWLKRAADEAARRPKPVTNQGNTSAPTRFHEPGYRPLGPPPPPDTKPVLHVPRPILGGNAR